MSYRDCKYVDLANLCQNTDGDRTLGINTSLMRKNTNCITCRDPTAAAMPCDRQQLLLKHRQDFMSHYCCSSTTKITHADPGSVHLFEVKLWRIFSVLQTLERSFAALGSHDICSSDITAACIKTAYQKLQASVKPSTVCEGSFLCQCCTFSNSRINPAPLTLVHVFEGSSQSSYLNVIHQKKDQAGHTL